jgi:glutamate--cysteine ligase catalytic subunit
VTFQARDVNESRYMYDQLAVLAPIMMALTAASPILKGRLADIDARWTVIAQSVDDRTAAEQGLVSDAAQLAALADPRMAGEGVARIPKSRYDSISTYIYHCAGEGEDVRTFAQYNDISCPVDETCKAQLRQAGLDENLAHHLAHLFLRDPIVAFAGQIELDDAHNSDHFESLQSTNWQSCRWKPPPVTFPASPSDTSSDTDTNTAVDMHMDGPLRTPSKPSPSAATPATPSAEHHSSDSNSIGWRTEFRSMEVQLTDFENAAFTVFVVLVTRVILAFDLGLYLPLSKVDANMQRAHLPNAVRTQKFFFRKHIAPLSVEVETETATETEREEGEAKTRTKSCCHACSDQEDEEEDDYEEMTMAEIFLGKESYFPGLLPLVYAYLEFINVDSHTYPRLFEYLQFIEK